MQALALSKELFNKLAAVARAVLRQEAAVLVTCLIIVLGTWGFIALADAVREGDTQAFDEATLRFLRSGHDRATPIGPAWIISMALDVTALGGFWVLSLVIMVVSGYLLLQQ